MCAVINRTISYEVHYGFWLYNIMTQLTTADNGSVIALSAFPQASFGSAHFLGNNNIPVNLG